MNLPWDKSYFKLCFYIIFTFMVIYIFKNAVDLVVYGIMNMGGVYRGFIRGSKTIISMFSVIITGFVIAYILNPLVEFFVRLNVKRGLSVMTAFFILIIAALIVISIIILNLTDFGRYTITDGLDRNISLYQNSINDVLEFFKRYNINIPKPEFDVMFLGKYATQLFLGFVISIYFLKDKEKIIANLKTYSRLLPEKINYFLNYILINLNKAFSGYIRGQLTDALIISAVLSLLLSIIGIPFAIPISIVSGFLNMIPYFGAVFGLILSVGITVLSGEYIKALYAAIAVFIIQQIDSIYISPKIIGESVRLSPVVVITALVVSSNMFGIWGVVLSVPIISFIKLVVSDIANNKNSK